MTFEFLFVDSSTELSMMRSILFMNPSVCSVIHDEYFFSKVYSLRGNAEKLIRMYSKEFHVIH